MENDTHLIDRIRDYTEEMHPMDLTDHRTGIIILLLVESHRA